LLHPTLKRHGFCSPLELSHPITLALDIGSNSISRSKIQAGKYYWLRIRPARE
jgi:hypothetical protein